MESKDIDVVIISGQSNGVGCSHSEYLSRKMGEEKFQEYVTGYPEIQIAYDCMTKDIIDPIAGEYKFYSQNTSENYSFMRTKLGQGNGKGTFGPEIGIAEKLHEKHANKLFLLKCACGASNLKDDWLLRNSHMYLCLMEFVRIQIESLKEMGYKPTIRAFCWMQGEGDAFDNYCEFYLENLREFVGNLREDLSEYTGDKEMAFIDAGISDAPVWEKYEVVNEAKLAFSKENENNYFIDTIAAGLHTNLEPLVEPDVYHYDCESEIQLGHLFAEKIEPLL